jgi:hypothetical protein
MLSVAHPLAVSLGQFQLRQDQPAVAHLVRLQSALGQGAAVPPDLVLSSPVLAEMCFQRLAPGRLVVRWSSLQAMAWTKKLVAVHFHPAGW